MKFEKRKRELGNSLIRNIKKNQNDKFYKFLRNIIIRKFNTKHNIPITTEDYGINYELIYVNLETNKSSNLYISSGEMRVLLTHPKIRDSLNIKKTLNYYSVFFNKTNSFELITKLINILHNTDPKEIRIEDCSSEDIFKPFIYVYNSWDTKYNLRKLMNIGDKEKNKRLEIEKGILEIEDTYGLTTIKDPFRFKDLARAGFKPNKEFRL